MPGYEQETDTVETDNGDYLFHKNITAVRITRRIGDAKLRVVMPHTALVDPWPEEFLWRPMKLLGVIDVWWSMHRSLEWQPYTLECVYQTAEYRGSQTISRELVADLKVWEQFRRHVFQNFIWSYQEALDERESTMAEMSPEERLRAGRPAYDLSDDDVCDVAVASGWIEDTSEARAAYLAESRAQQDAT